MCGVFHGKVEDGQASTMGRVTWEKKKLSLIISRTQWISGGRRGGETEVFPFLKNTEEARHPSKQKEGGCKHKFKVGRLKKRKRK